MARWLRKGKKHDRATLAFVEIINAKGKVLHIADFKTSRSLVQTQPPS
jgi:hypothetical protein